MQKFDQVIIIMEENMVVKRDPIDFDFDWPKDVDKNLKHGIEYIIKSNDFLAENKNEPRLNNYC